MVKIPGHFRKIERSITIAPGFKTVDVSHCYRWVFQTIDVPSNQCFKQSVSPMSTFETVQYSWWSMFHMMMRTLCNFQRERGRETGGENWRRRVAGHILWGVEGLSHVSSKVRFRARWALYTPPPPTPCSEKNFYLPGAKPIVTFSLLILSIFLFLVSFLLHFPFFLSSAWNSVLEIHY